MISILENNLIKITASTSGGELHSIIGKNTNTEFLWTGNPEYWKYHSPILFPIVGKVNNGKYFIDNKCFELPQHGLARLQEFKLICASNDKLTYELIYSEDTLKIYPYKFSLKISYELIDNSVKVSYIIKNIDNQEIYFSIGAHPAFICPMQANETIDDYYFEFNVEETDSIMELNPINGLYTHNRLNNPCKGKILPISKDLFKNDALVFDRLKSNDITLKSKNHNMSLSMNFEGFPYLGLWSIPTGAPFVCIEPWLGHADFEDFTGNFKSKAGVQKLDINKEVTYSYTIIISE